MTAFSLDLCGCSDNTNAQFEQLCQANPNLKFERTSQGELILVSPTGGISGRSNAEISADFVIWNRRTQLGIVVDSSTCFRLANGALRSPDLAWIRMERWRSLTPEQQQTFPPIAPDFVLELRSSSDGLGMLQAKMREYIENGVALGWLLDPSNRSAELYRPGQPVQVLATPSTLSEDAILPGLRLNLAWLWQ